MTVSLKCDRCEEDITDIKTCHDNTICKVLQANRLFLKQLTDQSQQSLESPPSKLPEGLVKQSPNLSEAIQPLPTTDPCEELVSVNQSDTLTPSVSTTTCVISEQSLPDDQGTNCGQIANSCFRRKMPLAFIIVTAAIIIITCGSVILYRTFKKGKNTCQLFYDLIRDSSSL